MADSRVAEVLAQLEALLERVRKNDERWARLTGQEER
jgi:hypothetical protein